MQYYTLKEFCQQLSISKATGQNWLRMHKITPDYYENGKEFFSEQYIISYQKQLKSGNVSALHSRRNKSYCSGSSLYSSYIAASSPNFTLVEQTLALLHEVTISEQLVSLLLAECALRMLHSVPHTAFHNTLPEFSGHDSLLSHYLSDNYLCSELTPLLHALIPRRIQTVKWIRAYKTIFCLPYQYVRNEDTLGFLYMSLRTLQAKKHTGAYYTPQNVVKKLVDSLSFDTHSSETRTSSDVALSSYAILDPGCGSGNFLLQLPLSLPLKSIHGTDIDPVSVALTRINLVLRELVKDAEVNTNTVEFDSSDFFRRSVKVVRTNIRVADFLQLPGNKQYTHVIGNPPWGYSFSPSELNKLRPMYTCIGHGRTESFDLFIEHSLALLKADGILSFVLPEAVLSVKSHRKVRQLICRSCVFTSLTYLGECFSGVQCPCVVLTLTKKQNTELQNITSCLGMNVETPHSSFTIQKERSLSADCLNFYANDTEYQLLQKLLHTKDVLFLSGHADFALGIVTGNNKKFIQKKEACFAPKEILLGTDISPYHIEPPSYRLCHPIAECQQAAPSCLYEASEKLVYRFISKYPIFAYDNSGALLLNSCNLVIPHLNGISIKYLLAILNSRITRFIYCLSFRSVKVLRSYLEQLPIPTPSMDEHAAIVTLVDVIISCDSKSPEALPPYEHIEQIIAGLFHLSDAEYQTICESLLHLDFDPLSCAKTPRGQCQPNDLIANDSIPDSDNAHS